MKTNTSKKIIATIVMLVLVVALATSLMFNIWQFAKLNCGQMAVHSIAFADSNSIVVEPGLSVLRTSEAYDTAVVASENVFTKTLTVTPDVISPDTMIDWSISFKDETATSANVTDYATITPTSDGALTAVLTVTDAFAWQIIVKATLRGNSAVRAICTVDYRKRITDYSCVYKMPGVEEQAVILQYYTESKGTIDSYFNLGIKLETQREFMNRFFLEIYSDDYFVGQFHDSDTSGIDNLINTRYKTDENVRNASIEFLLWLDYHNSTLNNQENPKEFTVPVFTCLNFIENARRPDTSIYVGGFYTDNTRDLETNELMLCRFLGITPHCLKEYDFIMGDSRYWEIDGRNYYFNISADKYKNQLTDAGITDLAIRRFKYEFNCLVDRWVNQGIALRTDDVQTWQMLGFQSKPDNINFDYIYIGSEWQGIWGNMRVAEASGDFFFGFNKFTVGV